MPTASSPASGRSPTISKRRKTRKGTFSCWECKHRKRRCEFEPLKGSTCLYCQSRGIPCISQEHADPRSRSSHGQLSERICHVESLVDQLIRQRDSCQSQVQPPAQRRDRASSPRPKEALIPSPFQQLCKSLAALLPHPNTAALILTKGRFFSLPFQTCRSPVRDQSAVFSGLEQSGDVSRLPLPTSHPIQYAQKLIELALGLQQLDLTSFPRPQLQLQLQINQFTGHSSRRYLDLAARHVTSQDTLVDSLDGLDTLLLEARYYINTGELRSAWLIFRRALNIAQLIGLPRKRDEAESRAESLWIQLVYNDRFLSLMLGLPCQVKDVELLDRETLNKYSPLRKLYRIHAVIAGRIIVRNVHMQHCDWLYQSTYDHYAVTRGIDDELRKNTRSVPIDCWKVPTLDSTLSDTDKMDKVSMLITQMHQHYLVILLHQPYLLMQLGNHTQISQSAISCILPEHSYSIQVVVPASREVLSRCLEFRNIRPILSYRGLEHKAFISAVTLLLSHILGHRAGSENVLEHQRPQNLAMIQQAIDTLAEVCTLNGPNRDSAIKTRSWLSRLLNIEAEAADGINYIACIERDNVGPDDALCHTSHRGLRFPIPYFGVICLIPEPVPDLQLDGLLSGSAQATGPDTAQLGPCLDSQGLPSIVTESDIGRGLHSQISLLSDGQLELQSLFDWTGDSNILYED
ncbi:C6 zinc finger domain protein [Aspergillus vadensis CBS 113365]|uniref:C6 zinc finger domain protein n=1 Tax=Aspergillus vadensis (strain CBS 113365 / IMI 142717 / IBT 24658) TaxID=1448311 RepID=A0A319B3Q0_ASPVC|nr:C6 zinc finger domain protein [Aspergillus vadensis CBS 113365]PYH66935.1 C6 zinc finger domain protein [Aspergillus vadensis CBS 113365]